MPPPRAEGPERVYSEMMALSGLGARANLRRPSPTGGGAGTGIRNRIRGLRMALTKEQQDQFRQLLHDKRKRLIEQAQETLSTEMVLAPEDRFDEVDQASSEYMQAFSFRLRGRERFLMDKIELALKKIDEGSFGTCEECEEPISLKRLQARPEAPLCIQCKEAQEKEEAVYAD